MVIVVLSAGSLAFAVVAAVAQTLSMVEVLLRPGSGDLLDAVLRGGVYFLLFHHAAVQVVIGPGVAAGAPSELAATVGMAPMAGTALVGMTLFLVGRSVFRREPGGTKRAALAAVLVAFPYAALSFGLALLDEAPAPLGLVGAAAVLDPRPLSALVWTLGLGIPFTALGALAAARERRPEDRPLRLGSAAVEGGWRMVWSLLSLASLGLLVVGALHPSATRASFDWAFSAGPAGGTLAVVGTATVAPNVAAGVGAVAMGGSLRLELLGESCTLVSYGRLPAAPSDPFPVGACPWTSTTAPPAYLVFLAVPAVATVAGGLRAARLAGEPRARDGMAMGIAAGVVFAAMFTAVLALSRVTVQLAGPGAGPLEGRVAMGPELGVGAALALGWGLAGGVMGGFLGSRRATGPGEPGPVDDPSRVGAYGAAGGGPAVGGAAGGGAAVLLSFHRI
jgi:hypothetical protein